MINLVQRVQNRDSQTVGFGWDAASWEVSLFFNKRDLGIKTNTQTNKQKQTSIFLYMYVYVYIWIDNFNN